MTLTSLDNFREAYKNRNHSTETIVVTTKDAGNPYGKQGAPKDVCPDCGNNTVNQGGCDTCPSCGWSKCSIA